MIVFFFIFEYFIIEGVKNMCNNENQCNGIKDILEIICILQKNANNCDTGLLDTCDKGFLGNCMTPAMFNTRPVALYTCNNEPILMPTSRTADCTSAATSCIFRVEKIDDCTATLRVLVPEADPTTTATFTATDSFFTVNLHCVGALRCLPDTFVEGVC